MKKLKQLYRQHKLFVWVTSGALLLGITFGQLLNQAVLPAVQQNPNEQSVLAGSTLEQLNESEAQTVYLLQLGAFDSYDNLLALVNDIQQLGYNYGVVKDGEQYVLYSHVVGVRTQLEEIQTALNAVGVSSFVKIIEIDESDLKAYYFLQAVKQIPFEMSSEFIQQFTEDDLYIFGYFTTLSNASFDALSSERQIMLLEIYQWLND